MREPKIDFEAIDQARRALELQECASLLEIRRAYRRLSKRYHPDAPGGDAERFRQVEKAYRLLVRYCERAPISFARPAVEEFDPEKWWYRRFGEQLQARPQSNDEGEEKK